MNLQALRTALLAASPGGWNAYDHLPGSATPPALVVGMPTTISFDASFRLATIALSVFLACGPQLSFDAEQALLGAVASVVPALQNMKDDSFRSIRVVQVSEFQSLTIGSTDCYGCAIDVELLASTT